RLAALEKVKAPVRSCLTGLGFGEQEFGRVIRAVGGWQKFAISPETDEITIEIDGTPRPISETLPIHPAIALILQNETANKNPEAARQARLAEIRKRKEEIRTGPPASMSNRLAEMDRLCREERELESKAPAPAAPKQRPADPALILKRR